eukprot:scaffold101553_cov30-Tisochrysis_lutea.AAC.3
MVDTMTGSIGLSPGPVLLCSIAVTTSMPSTTMPKTGCFDGVDLQICGHKARTTVDWRRCPSTDTRWRVAKTRSRKVGGCDGARGRSRIAPSSRQHDERPPPTPLCSIGSARELMHEHLSARATHGSK